MKFEYQKAYWGEWNHKQIEIEGNNISDAPNLAWKFLPFRLGKKLKHFDMNKINSFGFFQFGFSIKPVSVIIPGNRIGDWKTALQDALYWVRVTKQPDELGLKFSVGALDKLEEVISNLLGKGDDHLITQPEHTELMAALFEFQSIFKAELEKFDIYRVPRKGAFDTTILIDEGEAMFSKDIVTHLPPDAIKDIQQGAKCFAFGLPTAAGFHFLRAIESVIRHHYDALSNNAARPDKAAMGIYIAELLKLNAHPKLIAVLKQIKDLHRNPLSHPSEFLDMDEAQMLIGIMQSSIFAMMQIILKPLQVSIVP